MTVIWFLAQNKSNVSFIWCLPHKAKFSIIVIGTKYAINILVLSNKKDKIGHLYVAYSKRTKTVLWSLQETAKKYVIYKVIPQKCQNVQFIL